MALLFTSYMIYSPLVLGHFYLLPERTESCSKRITIVYGLKKSEIPGSQKRIHPTLSPHYGTERLPV